MRLRRVGRPIKKSTKTAHEIGEEIGRAMARNLNYNVMKEEEERLKNPPVPEIPKK